MKEWIFWVYHRDTWRMWYKKKLLSYLRLYRELHSIIISKDGKYWWTSNKGNKFCSFVQVQLRKPVLRSLYLVQLKGIIWKENYIMSSDPYFKLVLVSDWSWSVFFLEISKKYHAFSSSSNLTLKIINSEILVHTLGFMTFIWYFANNLLN